MGRSGILGGGGRRRAVLSPFCHRIFALVVARRGALVVVVGKRA